MTWSTLTPSKKRMRPRSKTKRQWNAPGRARPDDPLAFECEANIAGVCLGRASVRHHLIPRGPGSNDNDTLDVCDAGGCHQYIHAHGDWARACGFLRRPPLIKTLGHVLADIVWPAPLDDGRCPGVHATIGDTLPDGRRVCMGCGHGFELVDGVLPEHPRAVVS